MNKTLRNRIPVTYNCMEFFASAIDTLQILVIALGAGLGAWGVINLLEGYDSDNPGANEPGHETLHTQVVVRKFQVKEMTRTSEKLCSINKNGRST